MPHPEVVISYARENKAFVAGLADALKNAGVSAVWYDKEISPGAIFPTAIEEAISECNYFLPVISKYFLRSTYCRTELKLALERERPTTIIPVRIDPTIDFSTPKVLYLIRKRQYIDAPETGITIESFAALIKVLGAFKSEPAPAPVPERQNEIRDYPNRLAALADFRSAIEQEFSDISIIGSSLKGLLLDAEYRNTRELLQKKMSEDGVHLSFLFIHPLFADIRSRQEKREPGDIGSEIIDGLETLMKWDGKRLRVGLYKGTPTCFAIMTTTKMLLNPYPYRNVALGSPCIIIDKDQNQEFYNQFGMDHFGIWNTALVDKVQDLAVRIAHMKKCQEEGRYSRAVQVLYKEL